MRADDERTRLRACLPNGLRNPPSPLLPVPATSAPAAAPTLLERTLAVLGRLPLRVLRTAGAVLGLLVFAVSGSYRRKLVSNLHRAGYRGARITLAAAAGAGTTLGELPWIWSRPARELQARVELSDETLLAVIEQSRRGVLFLTPHLGAFEMTARWYAARAPITVLFREPRQALLRPLFERVRNADGMRAHVADVAGVRALMRALRAGEAVGLLPDQVPGVGQGQWALFFGAPAWTMVLPQRLAQATGALVMLAAGERTARGWRLHLEPVDEIPTPELLNRRIESMVRRWPAQYLWGYNRYKGSSEALSPSADPGER